MATYRVRAGKELAHHGDVLTAGQDVMLEAHIAHEVRHLIDEVDPATGTVRPIAMSLETARVLNDVARYRPHERVTLFEQAIAQAGAEAGAELHTALAQARRDAEAAAAPQHIHQTQPAADVAAKPPKAAAKP